MSSEEKKPSPQEESTSKEGEVSQNVWQKYPELPFVLPFFVFMIFTGLTGSFSETDIIWIYPLKTCVVAVLLAFCWSHYTDWKISYHFFAIFIGLIVLVVWVVPEGYYPTVTESVAFNPYTHMSGALLYIWISFRLIGASVVVPIMEEVFWRNFLLRWIINPDFKKVSLGTFTWGSFLIGSVLFGFEHHRWFVGILAGMLYSLILYRTKSIYACVLAHAVTNLGLGIYVLATQQWSFW